MAGTQTGRLILDSYATKLTLSLLGVVGLATAAGVLVYLQARSLFGADAGVIGSSILGLILITVISLALVGVTIGSNTIIALRRLTTKADQMADGDLEVDLDTNRTDEIGQLHTAFDSMRLSLREQISAAETAQKEAQEAREKMERRAEAIEQQAAAYEAVMQQVAAGDLTQRVDPATDSEAMQQVGLAFNETIDELETTVGEVMTFADEVETAAAGVDTTPNSSTRTAAAC
ncbi:MAG: HAMP domain protein, partial [Halonotius sp. J07HN6]